MTKTKLGIVLMGWPSLLLLGLIGYFQGWTVLDVVFLILIVVSILAGGLLLGGKSVW